MRYGFVSDPLPRRTLRRLQSSPTASQVIVKIQPDDAALQAKRDLTSGREGVFDFASVLLVSFGVGRPSTRLSRYLGLAQRLWSAVTVRFPGSWPMDARPLGLFPRCWDLRNWKSRKISRAWRNYGMYRSFFIHPSLYGSGMDGLTIVLMKTHPDEKKNIKEPCPYLGTLLPFVVEDVGRVDP